MNMKAICFSDVHAEEIAIEWAQAMIDRANPEIAIICGDFTTRGPLGFAEDFLDAIKIPCVAVFGNMDESPVAELLENRGVSVHLKTKKVAGIIFAGIGGSNPTPFGTPSEYSEKEITEMLSGVMVSPQTIFVSHFPPLDTKADFINGKHVGSPALRAFIEKKQPRACICGHIHEAEGVDRIGKTKIIKVPALQHGKALLLDMENLEVEELRA
ncbi:3',5'-cyclic adenosine monophosphate phosphodiesterase CpdA [Candidatus Norongarragalina meridionalis]|nr:3',5'-cyclic adenosine monophosphate phosphodiesterase CpdA [Candidatus Norongarragalina meridionalis]